jgi:O-antigen/teichoic acid export membrane protein
MIKKSLVKFFSINFILTSFIVCSTLFGSRALSATIFGQIILVQSILMVTVGISSLGLNYDLIRFGNHKSYSDGSFKLNINNLILGLLLSSVSSCILQFVLIDRISIWLLLSGTLFTFLLIYASYLRSLGEYIRSSIFEKAVSIISSIVMIFYSFSVQASLDLVGLLFLVTCSFTIFGLYDIQSFRILLTPRTLSVDRENISIRNQFYLSSVLMLSFSQADKLFLAESLDVDQLAIWAVYLQALKPFLFLGRTLFQYLLPELSNKRIVLKKHLFLKYFSICVIFGAIVFPVFLYGFNHFYIDKYEIDAIIVAFVCFIGVLNLFYQILSSRFLSMVNSSDLKSLNKVNVLLSITLLTVFYFMLNAHFLMVLCVSISIYWLLKILFLIYYKVV